MERVFPKNLKRGGTIGVASLTWKADEEKLYEGETILNTMGFEVDIHENSYLTDGQMAGTEAQRLQAFHELLADDTVDGIILARGGYGTPQLLTGIDYDLIKKNPKHIQGYSDPTALLNAIYAKTGLVTYHGPMLGTENAQFADEATRASFESVAINGDKEIYLNPCKCLSTGIAEGTLVGGNMTLLDQLIGTPYFPQDEKLILLLEDVGEKVNEVDKKLLHLKHAGILGRVQGVIFGDIENWQDNENPFGYKINEILKKYFLNIPCLVNVNCGHRQTILTMPIGAQVALHANDTQPKISLLNI